MSEEEKSFDFLLNQYYMTPKNWKDYKIIKNAIKENEELKAYKKNMDYDYLRREKENKDLKAINVEHQKLNGELRVAINEAIEYIRQIDEDIFVSTEDYVEILGILERVK